MEDGIQHDQAAQLTGLSTACARSYRGSYYPILSPCTNIESGTNNGGTSLLRKGGYMISDDIADNLAFNDFCKFVDQIPFIVEIPANPLSQISGEIKYVCIRYKQ